MVELVDTEFFISTPSKTPKKLNRLSQFVYDILLGTTLLYYVPIGKMPI